MNLFEDLNLDDIQESETFSTTTKNADEIIGDKTPTSATEIALFNLNQMSSLEGGKKELDNIYVSPRNREQVKFLLSLPHYEHLNDEHANGNRRSVLFGKLINELFKLEEKAYKASKK